MLYDLLKESFRLGQFIEQLCAQISEEPIKPKTLITLKDLDEGLSISEIARLHSISRQRVHMRVKTLEEAGYLDTGKLTPQGQKITAEFNRRIDLTIQYLDQGWNLGELETTIRVITRLRGLIEQLDWGEFVKSFDTK